MLGIRYPRRCLNKRSEDFWIVLRVKAFSQSEIERNYHDIKYLVGDIVNDFYTPQIEKDGIVRTVIPFVLFTNVTKLDSWNLWTWKEYDCNIYNIYHNSRTGKVYTVSDEEIDELKRSLESYEDFDLHEVHLGDRVTVRCGPFMGVSGTVVRVKSGLCRILVSVGMKYVTHIELPKDILLRE